MSRFARPRGEAGFTLVEMMMAIAIMGIILAPLGLGFVLGLRTTDETSTRLAGSNDAQLLSIWLPPDVHSASEFVAAPTANTECSGVTNLLRLKWTETQGVTTHTYVAAYAVQSVSGVWQLKRYYCVDSGAASPHVVGRNLSSSSAGTVSVSGTRVSMTLTMKNTPTDTTNYTFTVSANRRV